MKGEAETPQLAERKQRLSAYALILNDGHILLARIAAGYPGAGNWTLPGGGIDWGEHPEAAMHRELFEETGLRGDVVALLGVDSLRLERLRDGRMIGYHAVRLIYEVAAFGDPVVTETDGSVSETRWVPLDRLETLPTVEMVTSALGMMAARS